MRVSLLAVLLVMTAGLVPLAIADERPIAMFGTGILWFTDLDRDCHAEVTADLRYQAGSGVVADFGASSCGPARRSEFTDAQCAWSGNAFSCVSWHFPSWSTGGCQAAAEHLFWAALGSVDDRTHEHGAYPGCRDGQDYWIRDGPLPTTAVHPPPPKM